MDAPRAIHDHGFVAREIWTGESLAEHVGPNDRIGFRVKPSADGQWLAFVDRATDGNVAIRHVTTGEIRRITSDARAASAIGAKDAQMAFHPVLSPDGTHVAYEWASAGTYSMRIAPVAGGRARVLPLPDLYVAAIRWAPDGRTLALIATGRGNTGRGNTHIALMSVSDGTLTRLKSLPWSNSYTFGTDYGRSTLGGFSPDGRWLLYSVAGEQPSDGDAVFAIAVDGSQETKLVQGPSANQSPAWTPDGRAVVFVSDRSANFGLWSIPVANGKPIGAPELLRANVGQIQGLGFNRDGAFFYGRMNAQDDVLAAELDPATGTITSKPAPLIDRSMGSNRAASWSPDQRRLAFVRSTPTGDAVVVRSADGTERTLPTRFRDGGYRFAVPVWFPDGRSLLIPEIDRSIRRSTYRRVQIDTMEETVAFEGPN
jgi:Tol biopolymer transport system component